MTILIDHLNVDRSEDPGYWYLWALDFKNTFLFLYNHEMNLLQNKPKINPDQLPPPPGHISIQTLYFTAIELYLKAFLLDQKDLTVAELASNKWSHQLIKLRKRCSDIDGDFENKELKWVIDALNKLFKKDWHLLKYAILFVTLVFVETNLRKNSSYTLHFSDKLPLNNYGNTRFCNHTR